MEGIRGRFKDAPWFGMANENKLDITVIGAGGIGSRLVPLLSSLGVGINITLWDDDTVAEENIVSQFFRTTSVGIKKVNEVAYLTGMFLPSISVSGYEMRFTDGYVAPVCIAAVDSMESRKNIFNAWKLRYSNSSKYDAIYIDGRMNAEQYQVFSVTPDNIQRYEDTLFSDDSLEPENCTFKNTGHFGWLIASRITQCLTAFLANVKYQDEIYILPFKVAETGPVFDITIES